MYECMECDKIFERMDEVTPHFKETGHYSTMMDFCNCPMAPECVHKLKDEYCNYQSSKANPDTDEVVR